MKQWLHKKPMRPMQKPMPREMELPSGISNQAMLSMLESQGMQTAPRPASGGTPLDEAMRVKFERQFGLPMGDVRVHHNSDEPAKFGAGAYTYGTDVFIRPGQEKLLNHEMTHVAQQELGQVRPTGIEHGMAVNRSPVLEHSADMGTVPQMAGGATGPVVQCAEGERTQEIIDEKLREMAQPPLPAAVEPETKPPQDDLTSFTIDIAREIFQTGSHGDGKGPQEEGGFSIDVISLKSFLQKMLFQRYQSGEEQTQIREIIEKLEFKALPATQPTTPEEKDRYNFGTAYYHNDPKVSPHEIRYRVDPGFYATLPQLDDDYHSFQRATHNSSLTKTQYGFLAALLHEVGHAVQRNLLNHDPLSQRPNISRFAHEYHNILMHENLLPFRRRYQYVSDTDTSDETTPFKLAYVIMYSRQFLPENDRLAENIKCIERFFPHIKNYLATSRKQSDAPAGAKAIATTAIDQKDVATESTDSAVKQQPPAQTASKAPPAPKAPPTPKAPPAPKAPPTPKAPPAPTSQKKGEATSTDPIQRIINAKQYFLQKWTTCCSDVKDKDIDKILQVLKALKDPHEQILSGEQPPSPAVIPAVIQDVINNYSSFGTTHRFSFLMGFWASLFSTMLDLPK